MNTIALKWNITNEQKAYTDQAVKAVSRIVTKAQAEKDAKANGLWDYRNNKIVDCDHQWNYIHGELNQAVRGATCNKCGKVSE